MLPLPALLLRTSRCLREAVKDHIHGGGAVSASDAALAIARRLQHNTVGGSNSAGADFDVAVIGAGQKSKGRFVYMPKVF
jgi:hypothetical protein